MVGNEAYSFTNGFLGYHQVIIVKEDKKKETFTIEWRSLAYDVIPFGLKNALDILSRISIESFKDFLHKFLEV